MNEDDFDANLTLDDGTWPDVYFDSDILTDQLTYPGTFGIPEPVYIAQTHGQNSFEFEYDPASEIKLGDESLTEETLRELLDLLDFVKSDPSFKEHFRTHKAIRKLQND